MPLTPELVTVQRHLIGDDGAGGEFLAWYSLLPPRGCQGFLCSVNFYKQKSWDRLEDSRKGAEGAGVETQTLQLFLFKQENGPYPTVKINDVIVRPDDSRWLVRMVRPYDLTCQVDGELVQ